MRQLLTYLACFAAAAVGAAHAMTVGAGEHADFSRIVIPTGAADVIVDKSARKIDIRLSADAETVDLSEVNEKRKARRIVSAETIDERGETLLRLSLSCDCRIETARLTSGKLVIDIYDRADKARPDGPDAQARAARPAPSPQDEASFEEAKNRMRDLLQRAADEGFVTLREERSAPPATQDEDGRDETIVAEAPSAPARPPAQCLPDAAFAIDGGRFDAEPLEAIADYRERMSETEPEQQPALAEAFARGYLAIGFGEEALALLAGHGKDDSLLADMARVVAERPLAEDGPLLGAADCKGAHALWRAAVLEPAAAARAAGRSGEAISALPRRLRTLLAVRIAKTMIKAEAWPAAKKFYRIAEENAQFAPEEVRYIAARLLEQDGAGDQAEEMLRDVAAGDTQASQDALLALAERYAAKGEAPDQSLIEDLGDLAMTAKGSSKGGEAALLEAMAWIKSGNIEAGALLLENAARSGGAIAEKASAAAARAIGDALGADDPAQRVAGLRSFLKHRELIERGGRNAGLRADAAEAAADIGLPNLSLALLDENAGDDRARALVKARAALAADDAAAALAAAAPYTDDPAFAEIVVQANMKLDQHYAALAAASALPEGSNKAELAAMAAWRAGDFASAARAYRNVDPGEMNAEQAIRFAFAAYMAGDERIPPAAEAVLRRDDQRALDGLESLFSPDQGGRVVDRGKALVSNTDDEIDFIREVLGHG